MRELDDVKISLIVRGVAKGGPGGPGTPQSNPTKIIKDKTCTH